MIYRWTHRTQSSA